MKKKLLLFLFSIIATFAGAQKVTLNPTITPALFHYNDPITVTYDVTGTTMASLTNAWVWVWVLKPPGSVINAKYDIDPATVAAAPAQCTKSTPGGKTLFTITFTPASFFSSDISTQTQMGILLKGNAWGTYPQTTDYVVNFLMGNAFQTTLISPSAFPLFVTNGQTLSVQASASTASQYNLYINGKLFSSTPSVINYQTNITASDTLSYYLCQLVITSGTNQDTLSFSYLFSQASPPAARPPGIIDGINYNTSDPTKVTLCFWAPAKTSVYAFGDFTGWNLDKKYLMNRDGEHFWVEVTGLTSGQEYAFQYLVNDTLRIADPYSDKILDPDDNVIPATTYPNLKTVPAKAQSSQWYYNHFSVFQTGQTPYAWQTTNYTKPAKEKLVIYELLIRDFFDATHRNFQSLIDTISYFKRLGINAVELMPVAEFNWQIGWGYNPTSMFAVQKYYGTKNKLKEFIDKCHANGIAVIMDLVMNHQDIPNSYAMLDYDFVNFRPKASNKWFNVVAPHPYSVFNDLNHDSPYTRKYLDTINYYWMHEFKVDGYRYDLSKGFTQFNSGSNVGLWGQYDQSRVNNLQRMSNVLWSKYPDAYIILEHFADNSEETVLANYQVAQQQGMMLWENFNYAYNQNTMGFASGSGIGQMYYGNKGWTAPRAVGYMESHDEERLMYNNEQYGNISGNYSAKMLDTALVRMKAASLLFYTIPGPKMLWQFGEMGYDQSINECVDGTVNNQCRLDPKPVLWSYLQNKNRLSLWKHTQDLMRLRKNYALFTTKGTAQFNQSGLVQQIALQNSPYTATPTDSTQMNAVVVANMDVSYQNATVNFPHAGTWYDYYKGGAIVSVPGGSLTVNMRPGTYKLYTDVKISVPSVVTAISDLPSVEVSVYPNPTHDRLHISTSDQVVDLLTRNSVGAVVMPTRIDNTTWDFSGLTAGLYIIEVRTTSGMVRTKIIKY